MRKERILPKDSLTCKIVAFIVVIVMLGISLGAVAQIIFMNKINMPNVEVNNYFEKLVANHMTHRILDNNIINYDDGVKHNYNYEEYGLNDSNVYSAKIIEGKTGKVLWTYGMNIKQAEKDKKLETICSDVCWREMIDEKEYEYLGVFYVAKDLKPGSDFYVFNKMANWLNLTRNSIYFIGIGAFILALIALIYLLNAVGHKKDTPEIRGSFITKIPIDVYTVLTIIVGSLILVSGIFPGEIINIAYQPMRIAGLIVVLTYIMCAFISLLWLIDVAVRIKQKNLLKSSLIYKIAHFIFNKLCSISKGFIKFAGFLPLVWRIVLIFGLISLGELFGIIIFSWQLSGKFVLIWFIEKVVLFGVTMSLTISMKKLQVAGEKIAQGDLEYKVDTTNMYKDLKKHGENLNAIGQGMNLAIGEKLKGERMKTELITNVSHDIKTPLTSIINYSDLINKEKCDNENIKEYSEVLNRQSVRLKRLIEDLLEASKAATGNLEVNLEKTEVGVMLDQTEGEYQDKLSANNLNLVVNKPEEPIYILADGRRLWRVLDNILNNVCKYAMPGTRVYLNLEIDKEESNAVITLKNISKDPLNISPDELLERFVQGDTSRKSEGNGLGLSIANSLMELQKGKLRLEIDGDLFKVTLRFPCLNDNN